jgi:uncharacterized protein YjbJ (UPF0337 family)
MLQAMQDNSDLEARQRFMGLQAAVVRVERQRRRASAQARRAPTRLGAAASDDHLTSQERTPRMRSARQDTIRGAIDRIAGRVLEAFGRLTGKRSTAITGKAARIRGAGRSTKGRLKRHLR